MPSPPLSQPSSDPRVWLGVLAYPTFAVIWATSSLALIGLAMYDTASGWLMTQLDLDPLDVSLLHAAVNLPMFLFTLPAGAIADIVNPRRTIIAVSAGVAGLIAIFASLVSFDLASPALLLLTTFLLSAAWSLSSPAWLSILPSLVPKSDLSGAIAANGVAYNVSRTVGPALGGFIIMNFGVSTPFWAFVAANLGVIAALLWWRGACKETAALPAERLNSAVRTGIRHAAHNRLLRATLVRAVAVYPFAAAYWGLLPLIARRTGHGAEHFGLFLSMVSAGAVVGSISQRRLRARIDLDRMVVLGTVATAGALWVFSATQQFIFVLGACFCAGVGWVVILTGLYVSAENALPEWVRGRGLAIFLTVIFGTMTVCSAAWGEIAGQVGLSEALLLSAAGIVIAMPLSWRWKLQQSEALDLSPSLHWAPPKSVAEIADDRGPILVKIEYRIDLKDRAKFLRALDELGEERRRHGAFAWGVFEDMSEFGRFEEGYLIESWLELKHVRERVTVEDRALEDEISEMLLKPPRIEFLVASERRARARPHAAAGA
ncbi:MAG: MFS transporter [Candidatus Eremiobacteraeota bacterium]|nr:MFS transporter [Candidatus Eremiobacteraeota bacterium]